MNANTEAMDALLAQYVAGSLPAPAHVLVAAHLTLSEQGRRFVNALETAAGDALLEMDSAPIDGRHGVDDILISDIPAPPRKNSPDPILPDVLADFLGHRIDDIPWRTKLPGFREYDLGEIDGLNASLFWLRPGRKVPDHTHQGLELTLVLDGAFNDLTGRYARGDLAIADDSLDHRPIAELDRPCIGFAVTEAPLKLTGPLHRRFADILGLS